MESLLIPATELTPAVNFDGASGKLFIEGKSLPEDSRSFYQPILDWVQQYSEGKTEVKINLFLSYFNSSSAKQLIKLLYLFEDLSEKGVTTGVNWIHKKSDTMMQERGEELAMLVSVPFTYEVR